MTLAIQSMNDKGVRSQRGTPMKDEPSRFRERAESHEVDHGFKGSIAEDTKGVRGDKPPDQVGPEGNEIMPETLNTHFHL